MASHQETEELYPIRTVASLTGVNPITLRAWERRYGLIKPRRTKSGHRLYSKHNIEMINRAVELQKQGIPIGRAARLLRQHAGNDNLHTSHSWAKLREEMLEAVADFSETRLDLIYEDVLARHSIREVISQLIVPALEESGRRWQAGELNVAEEHFFTVYLRNKIGVMLHHRTRLTRGSRILIACVPDNLHEVGMLLFALAAHDRGYRPVILGANMPLDALLPAAVRAGCRAIVLSACCEPAAGMPEDLRRMAAITDVPVFVGGTAAAGYNGVTQLGADIEVGLSKLAEYIGPPTASAHLQ